MYRNFTSNINRVIDSCMNTKILSFDGGGIRGAITLTFLKSLEKDTGISVSQKPTS